MSRRQLCTGVVALGLCFVIFILPFLFIFLTAAKTRQDAAELTFTLPGEWRLWENFMDVIQARNYMLMLAYFNSILITVVSVVFLVLFGAMVGYILQRRDSRWNKLIYALTLTGLMIPPAVVPTIWVLQSVGLFKTISG